MLANQTFSARFWYLPVFFIVCASHKFRSVLKKVSCFYSWALLETTLTCFPQDSKVLSCWRYIMFHTNVCEEERKSVERKEEKMVGTYWTGRCGPPRAVCKRLNPSQNGRPARSGTRCQASGRPRRESLPGWRSRVSVRGGESDRTFLMNYNQR